MSRAHSEPLLIRLRKSSTAELVRLIEDYATELSIREVRQVFLNPFAGEEVARAIAAIRHLSGEYQVRFALARFHRTPEPIALRIIPSLRWRDLLEVSLAARVRPVVQRAAERYIEARLSRLTAGERITLARRAVGGLLSSLMMDGQTSVVNAALENPRLTLEGVVRASLASEVSPQSLDSIAASRWARSYEVKAALSRNPNTPFQRIVALLPDLRRAELEAIGQIEAHSSFVRMRAREQLESKRHSS